VNLRHLFGDVLTSLDRESAKKAAPKRPKARARKRAAKT